VGGINKNDKIYQRNFLLVKKLKSIRKSILKKLVQNV
jgi:hypothetical protein